VAAGQAMIFSGVIVGRVSSAKLPGARIRQLTHPHPGRMPTALAIPGHPRLEPSTIVD